MPIVRLSQDDIHRLHESSCGLLEEIGIMIHDPEAVAILVGHGAVRKPDGAVAIPRDLIERSLQSASSSFRLYDRRGRSFEVGTGKHRHAAGGTMTDVLDWPGWRQRPATRADLVRLIRLCDSLPLIDIVVPMVEPQDVDPAGHEVAGFLETFTNTTKHCLTAPLSAKTARAWLEMARIAADGTPLSESPVVSLVAAILPGLEIDAQSAGIMVLTAREGVPLVLMASCLAGGQTPITVAGSAALANAGTLAGLALAQCVRPGSPVLAYCGCQAMDLRACEISESGPENVLGTSVMSQLAKHYRLPTYACAADTDAKTGDVQAGMEKMGGMLGALADGIDVTINAGAINRASAASEVQLVVDHEMLRYLDRIERGVPVTEETLALDVIRSAGRRGSFLETEHTLRHMRKSETVYFELFDRTACRKPAEDLYARAKINCEELLNVWMSAVPAEVQNRLNDYVRNFK